MTVSALDVAAYIIRKLGFVDAMKLQKLVYYSQCYSLVWDERPLFREEIEAWVNGPVVDHLWRSHANGALAMNSDPDRLDADQRETVDLIIERYSGWSARDLSDNTHAEQPWKRAREGYAPDERGSTPITHDSMRDYYSNRDAGTKALRIPAGLNPAALDDVLRKGRLKNLSPSGILDVVARQVASSQRLEGVEVTSADIRKHLDGRSGT